MKRPPHKGSGPDLRDEQNAFALSCFRAIGSASAAKYPLNAVRDWKRATQTLEIHGLLPFLGLAAVGASPVPDEVRQLVLKHTLRLALYNANALDALNDISREMRPAGIPYAVLKGTYLYELLYRDLFPRAYGDIDLLVPANRIEEARGALEKAGYGDDPKDSHHGSMPWWHFHVALIAKKPGGLPVELHRSLVDRVNLYRIREGELFGRLTEFKARQGSFTVLSAEDQLIYLCLHVAKHGILNSLGLRGGFPAEWYCGPAAGNRLLWFLDIELFLQKQKDHLDWQVISERVNRWNVADDVMDCLRVLKQLRSGSPAEYALDRLSGASFEVARPSGTFSRLLQSQTGQSWLEGAMRMNPRFSIRPIRCFLVGRSLVPSPSRLLGYYGKKNPVWLPWLYLIHPFHMIRKMLRPA